MLPGIGGIASLVGGSNLPLVGSPKDLLDGAVGGIKKLIGIGGGSAADERDAMRKKLQSLGFAWRTKHGENPNDIDAFDNLALSNLGRLYMKFGQPVIKAYNSNEFSKQNLQSLNNWDKRFAKKSTPGSVVNPAGSGMVKKAVVGVGLGWLMNSFLD